MTIISFVLMSVDSSTSTCARARGGNGTSAAQNVRQARVVRAIDAKGALTVLELGRFRADPNARIELASSTVTPVEHIDGDNGRGACRGSVGKQLAELTRRALIAIGARGE